MNFSEQFDMNSSAERTEFLDRVARGIQSGEVTDGMEDLFWGLRAMREKSAIEDWQQFAALPHSLRSLIHESPFSKRAYVKPRGYPGDAVMLDYVYGCKQLPPETSDLGTAVFAWESRAPGSQGIRSRRKLLARKIDEIASRTPEPHVLSVACGHMREAALSVALRAGRLGVYTGLDQDAESLDVVRQEFGHLGIDTVQGSVRDLLHGKFAMPPQDFVYTAGLYDYLSSEVASRLTRCLFEMLQPGGTLLIANVAPEMPDAGYMEFCMDWWLICRSEIDALAFAAEIPTESVESCSTFRDCTENIVFLEIRKPL